MRFFMFSRVSSENSKEKAINITVKNSKHKYALNYPFKNKILP